MDRIGRVTGGVLAIAVTSAVAWGTPFTGPGSGPLWDGSYDPGYAPTYTMYFTGSLYTIDTDGDGLGDDGVVSFGNFAMTSLGGNAINPATSLRAFNVRALNGQPDGETAAPVVNHDPFPSWDPDTPDADANWNTPRGEYYGFDLALGAGKALSTLPTELDWAVTLYPYDTTNPGNLVQPYSGVVENLATSFVGDGTGGVVDQMHSVSWLRETDGRWDVDYGADGTDDESYLLDYDLFLSESTLFEVGNMFTITNPITGVGTWTLNEWSSIDPDTGLQQLNGITPVPEPATLLLLGGAVVSGLGVRRRIRGR